MPRRRRAQGAPAPRPRAANAMAADDNSLDSALDGDLEDCGSPGAQGHHPVQRNAANARERARMRVLSRAFCRLKTTLPWVPADTKLSKLDTLRLATSYIAHLRDVLLLPEGEVPAHLQQSSPTSPPHPRSLTWPFTFQQPGPEPWISRTASSTAANRSTRCVNGGLSNPSSGSSNASSCADDDGLAPEDEQHQDREHDDERQQREDSCRRLSGGCLLEMESDQHYLLPDAYLQRYELDVQMQAGKHRPLLDVGYTN